MCTAFTEVLENIYIHVYRVHGSPTTYLHLMNMHRAALGKKSEIAELREEHTNTPKTIREKEK